MNRLLLTISAAICLSGCADYVTATHITLVNNSSHKVTIEGEYLFPAEAEDKYVINPGESVSYFGSDYGVKYQYPDLSSCIPYSVKVTFDDKYQVEHKGDIPNNMCIESSYTLTEQEKYDQYYAYTFTDTDYEYAVSASEDPDE